MTATAQRFWVEITPRLAVRPAEGPTVLPRLTGLAVAAGLEGADLDAELASVHRQLASLAAYRAGLVERKAALGAQHPLPFAPGTRTDTRPEAAGDPDPSLQAADDFLPDEVAVLLRMSVPSARYLVDDDLVLVRQLPVVWHALADGRIDETRAKVLVRALRYQAASWGGPVADDVVGEVAARGVEWAAAGCPPTTLRERVDAALVAADPEAADRRRTLRKREADVRVQGTGDGLADLRATHLDAADAALVKAQLDAFVRTLKAEGDDRPAGQIRTALVVTLLTRPWEKLDPAIAHLTINADLADLLVPGIGDLLAEARATEAATEPEAARAGDGAQDADAPPADDGTRVPGGGDERTRVPDGGQGTGAPSGSAQVGDVGGLPVSPAAVRELLRRIDALGLTHPDGGELAFTITGEHGRLLAVATPEELLAAARAGRGLGPPPPTAGYTPTAAQYRYLRARDRHCRFPGCRQVALRTDADHVVPYDHRDPAAGGPTCVTNLVLLCRRHHRLKTFAPDWRFALDADGTLHVTTPGGSALATRPPGEGQILDLGHPPPPPHDPVADPAPF